MACQAHTVWQFSSRGATRGLSTPFAKATATPRIRTALPRQDATTKSPIGHVAHDSASAGLESSSRGFLHSRQPSLHPCGRRSSLTQLRTCSFTQRSTNRLASQMLGLQCAPPTPANDQNGPRYKISNSGNSSCPEKLRFRQLRSKI